MPPTRPIFSHFFALLLCIVGLLWMPNLLAATPTKDQRVDKLTREIHSLNEALKKIQERVASVATQVETLTPPLPTKVSKVTNDLSVQYVRKFNQHVNYRLKEFILGFEEAMRFLQNPPSPSFPIKIYLWRLIVGSVIGLIAVFTGRWLLNSRALRLLEALRQQKIGPVSALAIMTAFFVVPVVFYFMISLLLAFFFESREVKGAIIAASSNYYAFLPINLYVVWAGFAWTRLIFSPARASQALIPIDSYGSYRASIWIRISLVTYFVGEILLGIAEVFSGNDALILALSDTIGLVISLMLLRTISIITRHLSPHPALPYVVRALTLLRWLILGFCTLWLIGRQWFSRFLMPTLATGAGLAVIRPLQRLVRRWRLHYLRTHRHQKTLWVKFLRFPALINHIIQYILYCLILGTWIIYLWNFYDFTLYYVLESAVLGVLRSPVVGYVFNSMLIFIGAIVLVQAGEKILKYYVEDKYSGNEFIASRLKTLMALFRTLLRVVIWMPAISMIFTQFGDINITAWITSIGAASFGLTFGFQNIVRDFITGFIIILENNIMVGDEVEVDSRTGQVEEITLRTLRIRTDNGVLLTIPFGTISVIGNKNRNFSAIVMNISVGYDENIDRIQSLIEKSFSTLKKTPGIGRRVLGPLEVRGVTEITFYSIVFQIKMKTLPNMQEGVRRAFNKILKQIFDEAGIVIPTPPHAVYKAQPSLSQTTL